MFLERVEIVGFRGINRLSLQLEDNTVLLGENAWGKSSLLDAMTLLLAPHQPFYQFEAKDFHWPLAESTVNERHLQVIFTFCEKEIGQMHCARYRPLLVTGVKGDDRHYRIYYSCQGELAEDGSILTLRRFLDANGDVLPLQDVDQQVQSLLRLHPVLRLRDARFIRRLRANTHGETPLTNEHRLQQQLDKLRDDLAHNQQRLTPFEAKQFLPAMQQLLQHYFAEQGAQEVDRRADRQYSEQWVWRLLDNINRLIAEPKNRAIRLTLISIFSNLLQANSNLKLAADARPLLLIENPETRLHPIMLSVAWNLLEQMPVQRITTTNSSTLVSLVPVEQICRLVRESNSVVAYRLGAQGLSIEEGRRIAFHIRFNRPSSLFARCWLLVEGETEVWLLNELARQCGYHFDAEGVRVIEFAQCGLRPLLKFARRMGIEWHVLVDGDEAGKKYANIVRSLLNNYQQKERDRLTELPAADIENFMYREGYSSVYYRVAGLPSTIHMPMRNVIRKAVQRSSKPDLAIEVAMQAASWGTDAVPTLLKKMFSRIIWLARGQADE
ncbi:ATP-dependent nuclease [Serratia microhaemolytica]|uniref:ATP-dependent nuclease n=1 Tax=Serratia microhaemolytica TaxID=2675110 RepID=UPI000FDD1AE4|nr:ATP-dependent endonuclease [Serratia microhaemolytica]